jgi:menaquinol-cytochrome c reductase iron-sulfur subunit
MTTHQTAPSEARRGFLEKLIAVAAGGLALLAPIGVGLGAFFSPLRRRADGAGDFLEITRLEMLPADGTPRKFAVITDRVDAWNKFVNVPVGSVFLRRMPEKPSEVVAFQVICPHAGCSIGLQSSAEGAKFFCPCHLASFDLEGRRTDAVSASPRDMDGLDVEIRNGNEVWVKFQNFVMNQVDKVPVA